jgi:hypothetical protein
MRLPVPPRILGCSYERRDGDVLGGSSRPSLLIALTFLLILWPAISSAQSYFGKNKVQYESREWFILRTPHTEIFYYPEEEGLAREVAAIAESTCAEFDTTFNMTLEKPIPILLYAAHQHFQQTNAARGLISEGVGGLTELIKGRVILPHTGSRHRLVWVTRHELGHAYMLAKLSQVLRDNKKYRYGMPPLWFIEGLAEFVSTTWDSQAEGLLQDAVVSNLALPMTESGPITGSVLMYKEGQSFLLFLAEKYSRRHVMDLLENWWREDSFEKVFQYTFDRSLRELDVEWFAELRRQYYPYISEAYWTDEAARQITDGMSYDLAPTVYDADSDSSYRFFYLSANNGATDLKLGKVCGNEVDTEKLLRGGFSSKFESFHLFRSQLGVSTSGLVALVAQGGGRDVLHIYDGKSKDLLHTLAPKGLIGLSSPTWMPEDSAVVVVGQRRNGQMDLFRVRAADGSMVELTDDPYDDQDPSADPLGNRIVFASDRDGGKAGYYHLYELDLVTGESRRLTSGSWSDRDPMWSPDGSQVIFRSDRNRISNLFLWKEGEVKQISNFLGPVQSPSWLPDGRSILFAGQSRLMFHIYQMEVPHEEEGWAFESTDLEILPWPEIVRSEAKPEPYTRRMGLDIAQNGVALDPSLGAAGAGQFALTDMLGNESIYFFLANDSESLGSFLDGMEVGVSYFNQAHRMNYGIGLFRLTRMYDPALDLVRRERRVGGSLTASYPLSKFNRIEGSFVLRYAQDHLLRNAGFVDVWLASNFLNYVHDNTRWTHMGPTGGMRWNLGGGYTRDMTTGLGDFFTLRTDFRRYVEPITSVVSATRLLAQSSFGDDPQRSYLGGRFDLRGWPRRSLQGHHAFLFQQEFRFPLWHSLTLGVPSTWTFPPIYGAIFGDVGIAGDRQIRWNSAGSVGAGMYIGGGYYPAMRLDFIRRFDFQSFQNDTMVRFSFMFMY